jgi:cytochrome c oxidase assembly protein subunit 15
MALVIFVGVAWLAGAARRRFGGSSPLGRLSTFWFAVILLQVILGAATIWTGKAADIATLHVATGAIALVTGGLLSMVAFKKIPVMGTERESSRQHIASTRMDPQTLRA